MVDGAEVVKRLMKSEKVTQTELADSIQTSRQAVSQMLNRNSDGIKLNSFQRMIEAMGYEVVIQKKNGS